MVAEGQTEGGSLKLNIAGKGVYIVKVDCDSNTYIKKIIIR